MKLLSLTCNHCGAPLEAPTKTRYLTCAYCNSRLEVKREGQAVYTEVLEAIEERTARIAEDVETIKLQNEIERLDREWTLQRERYLVKGQEGDISVPSTAGSVVGGLVGAGFGVAWTIFTASIGAPFIFPVFGILFIVLALAGTFSGTAKAEAYRLEQGSYESRRRALLARLRERSARES